MKLFIIPIILFFSLSAFSQNMPIDSSDTEPIDTNNAHHFGFLLGGGFMGTSITPSNVISADTFSGWESKAQPLFLVGILYNKDFSSLWSFQTGAIINLSKIILKYNLNSISIADTTNFSTLCLPIFFSYKLNDKPNGIKLTAGLTTELDISKKGDKNNRVFPLKVVSPTAYGAIGYQVKTLTSILDAKLFGQINPLNLLANKNNIYSNSLNNLSFWRMGIIIILR